MEEHNMQLFRKLHRVSLIVGGLSIILPLIFWGKIPERIPLHYNAAGVADNWAEKSSLILLFFVIAMLMGVMSIAVYLVRSNMESQYSSKAEKNEANVAYPVVVLMNLALQCMFAYIMLCCATGRNLGTWFLPVFLVGTFAPLAFMIYKIKRMQGSTDSEKAIYKQSEKQETGMKYRTAIDWWLGLLLGGCELMMLWFAIEPIIRTGEIAWGMVIVALVISVMLLPLFGIKYILYSEHMLISVALYGKERIRYEDIIGVKETLNPLSSAAMSIRRIQIDYIEAGVRRMVLISPIKKKQFLKQLEEKRGLL